MWNLEKWHRLTVLQGKNRDTDREQIMDMRERSWGEINWEIGIDLCVLPCVKQIVGTCCIAQGVQLGALW